MLILVPNGDKAIFVEAVVHMWNLCFSFNKSHHAFESEMHRLLKVFHDRRKKATEHCMANMWLLDFFDTYPLPLVSDIKNYLKSKSLLVSVVLFIFFLGHKEIILVCSTTSKNSLQQL